MRCRFPTTLLSVAIYPSALTSLILLNMAAGKGFVDNLDLPRLILFHPIRIRVEQVLFWLFTSVSQNIGPTNRLVEQVIFWLFTYQTVPKLMMYEDRSSDIFRASRPPKLCDWQFRTGRPHTSLLLGWYLICLVMNVAMNGLLPAPSPFQQFVFEQPTVAISCFPFNLLPACLMPLVILPHLVAIRQLLRLDKQLANTRNP